MTTEEYLARDATSLAAGVRDGEFTATELLDAALERAAEVNPTLNAIVHLRVDSAREEAAAWTPERIAASAAPFPGVPFLIKDLSSALGGHPLTCGSRLLEGRIALEDSELVRRYRAAGMVIFGSTNAPEFGLQPVTEPELYGPSRNPWDPDRTPGGSSGGTGAAVAGGIVPMAGGGDGGGSIRIPASCCGIFGMKPTRQRTPSGPRSMLWRGAAVEHVLGWSVRDSAEMLDAIAEPEPGGFSKAPAPSAPFRDAVDRDPLPLRIAFTGTPLLHHEVDPECLRGLEATVALLEDLGHTVEEVAIPLDGEAFAREFLTMVATELAAELDELEEETGRRARAGRLEPETWALALVGRSIRGSSAALSLRRVEEAARRVAAFLEPWDALLTPTLASPPVRIGELSSTSVERMGLKLLGRLGSGRLVRAAGLIEQAASRAFLFTPWTPVFNVTGQPAMSVPLHRTPDGLPVGMHFVGRFGDEETLYSLAGQLERARPWGETRPEL